jgi:hypothetical protein
MKSGHRVFVWNIFHKLIDTNPVLAVKQAEKLIGEICAVSASTVHNVRTEFKTSGGLRTAGKKRQLNLMVEKYRHQTVLCNVRYMIPTTR